MKRMLIELFQPIFILACLKTGCHLLNAGYGLDYFVTLRHAFEKDKDLVLFPDHL